MKKLYVFHVTLNVLPVLELMTIVTQNVLWEESTHHSVIAQKDNTMMNPTSVDHVTINVNLVLNTENVLNVLNPLTEMPQKNANVSTDISIITLPFVKNVLSNVIIVLVLELIVMDVAEQELTLHYVTAQNICGKTMTKKTVTNVTKNVMVVITPPIVENVLKTELTPQPVTVQLPLDSMTMVMLYVQNVLVYVTPVLNSLSVTFVLVSESTLQVVNVQLVCILQPICNYLLVMLCVPINMVLMMILVLHVDTDVKLVLNMDHVTNVLKTLSDLLFQIVNVLMDIMMKPKTQPVDHVCTNVLLVLMPIPVIPVNQVDVEIIVIVVKDGMMVLNVNHVTINVLLVKDLVLTV